MVAGPHGAVVEVWVEHGLTSTQWGEALAHAAELALAARAVPLSRQHGARGAGRLTAAAVLG
ncbi:MAG: hypothetical protein K0A98_02310 [Trueperaceae bacterium]|nr:hypothetical protein [Trueperaceae bacterium]